MTFASRQGRAGIVGGGVYGVLMDSPLVPPAEGPGCVPSAEVVAGAREAFAAGDAAIVAMSGEVFARGSFDPSARTAGSWLSQHGRVGVREAKRLLGLADTLRTRYPRVAAGMVAGAVSVEHAQVIAAALRDLPPHVSEEQRDKGEELLVESAAVLSPRELGRVARQLHEELASRAPDVDDPDEAEQLAAELAAAEARAAARRAFWLRQRSDGSWHGRLTLPAEAGATVSAALESLANPRAAGSGAAADDDAVRDDRTRSERMADALHELCQQVLDSGELPEEGGERPHVNLTVRWETLLGLSKQLTAAGMFDVGGTLGVAETRRLLCDAQIVPVVMGGASEVLDIGRSTRVWTTAQRRAVAARDGGCVFPGCYKPIRATHVHHMVHWSRGGPTSVANGALLCLAHHRQVHLQGWEMRLARDGLPELIPPPTVDPLQRPRQHDRFRIRRTGT
jgi:hypothetical protein